MGGLALAAVVFLLTQGGLTAEMLVGYTPKMPFGQYLASSFIGLVPMMVLFTTLGQDLDPLSAPVLVCAGVELACILGAWLFLRLRRKKRKEAGHEET